VAQAGYKVGNLNALRALPPSILTEGTTVLVLDDGSGDQRSHWYTYFSGRSDAEDLPDIVIPTFSTGRWVRSCCGSGAGGSTIGFGSTPPPSPPTSAGQVYWRSYTANLVDRRVQYLSVESDTPGVFLWQPINGNTLFGSGNPQGNVISDFPGQFYFDFDLSILYVSSNAGAYNSWFKINLIPPSTGY